MSLIGTVALIIVVILSILVLRVKSDPLEDKSIRAALSEAKRRKVEASSASTSDENSQDS
jgi:hypothetical protein